jgi:hypothetical protein
MNIFQIGDVVAFNHPPADDYGLHGKTGVVFKNAGYSIGAGEDRVLYLIPPCVKVKVDETIVSVESQYLKMVTKGPGWLELPVNGETFQVDFDITNWQMSSTDDGVESNQGDGVILICAPTPVGYVASIKKDGDFFIDSMGPYDSILEAMSTITGVRDVMLPPAGFLT